MKTKEKVKQIRNISIIFIILVAMGIMFPTIFNNLKFGLDLQGGFEVLYQVKSIDGSKVTEDMVKNTYKTISTRIDSLGITEPVIIVEGLDRIRVQLAGVKNPEEARNELSSVASLTFRDTNDHLLMTSDVLRSGGAKVGTDDKGNPAVSLGVNDKDTFFDVTKKVSESSDRQIVIWLDFEEGENSYSKDCGSEKSARCLSVATVSQGFASDVIIQGNFTTDEVEKLVRLINSGSLPTKLVEISSKTVEASFGANSLSQTFTAGIIGISAVVLLMVALYRFAGLIASIGIYIYTFLTFLSFWLFGGVLTLPGIAALVIGIGMAIDACVISFARIKDELHEGTNLQDAYKLGNKNSFMTIFDANITTLLVAIIMFILGESSVKGFATMLIISIFVTMVVMVYVTRFLLGIFVKTRFFDKKLNLFIGIKEKKKEKNKVPFSYIDFVKPRKTIYIVTIIIFIIGIISLFTSGLNLGIDFKGGSSVSIASEQKLDKKKIEEDFKNFDYDLTGIEVINDNNVIVELNAELDKDQVIEMQDYFTEKYQAKTDIGVVSNMVSKELVKNSIIAVCIAIIGIIIYVSIRFTFSYAVTGVIALIHDASMIIILFSLFKLEVSSIFIAAVLSIIGYSINDTVVIFDRMRDMVTKKYKGNLKNESDVIDVVNTSLRFTFARSIITTSTALLTVIALTIFGSHEIFNFNIAMLFGLIAGAYSSIAIAAQLWLDITRKNLGKKIKKKWYEEDDDIEEIKIKGINS